MPIPSIAQQVNDKADHTKKLDYPNKIFNLSEHFIPTDMKALFRFCWYYYLTHPALYQAISRSSEYPVTDLVFDTEDEELKDKYEDLFYKKWKIRTKLIECGNSERVFGNTFVSVNYSPIRYIECPKCRKRTRLSAAAERPGIKWNAAKLEYQGKCSKKSCSHSGAFRFRDIHPKKPEFMNLVLWSPNNMRIKHNPITGNSVYYYQIPNKIKNLIRTGDADFLAETPEIFLGAVRNGMDVRLNQKNFFHMARPGISSETDGWGLSVIIPILQDLFYRGVLRRAQESVAIDHVVPLRFLFPQTSAGSQPPEIALNMSSWKDRMEEEVRKWRKDENYIPIVPTPVGVSQMNSQGARGLFVTPEIQQVDQNTVIGTGCPLEFVWGGLSYSGTSVSMRMLENSFMTYRDNLEEFLNFLVGIASTYLGWAKVNVRLSEFKMADDALRRDTFLKLRMNNDVSKDTMLSEMGLDAEQETKKIRKELLRDAPVMYLQQKLQANAMVEGQKVLSNFEQRLQSQSVMATEQQEGGAVGQEGAAQGGYQNVDPTVSAFNHAGMINQIKDPNARDQVLQQIHAEMPEYGGLIQNILEGVFEPGDMPEELPEQRPPSRGKGLI